MSDNHVRHYEEGHRAALVSVLHDCARRLGYDDPLAKVAFLIEQRERVRVGLRRLCERFGDADYPDDLDLGDVIDSYLEPYLEDGDEDGPEER